MPTKPKNESLEPTAIKPSAAEAARVLATLSEALAAWRWKWPMLRERLDGLRVFQTTLAEDHPDYTLAAEVCRVLAAERQIGCQVTASELDSLLASCLAFEDKAKTLPEWDTAGHIYGALHSLVNIVNSLRDAAQRIADALRKVSQQDPGEVAELHWGVLRELAAHPDQLSEAHLTSI